MPTAFFETAREDLDPADLAAHVEALVERPARPRRFVRIDAIPRNHVGKPLRRVLRKRLADERWS